MGLRDATLRQQRELPGGDMAGVFIAEGDVVIERAIAADYRLVSVLIDAARSAPLPPLPDVPVFAAGPAVLKQISGFGSYRGAMACFARRPVPAVGDLAQRSDLTTALVTEGVNNPTNMGVMLRSAAGLGAQALFHDPTSCDPLTRRCCRISMGEGFAIASARLDPLPNGLAALHTAGWTTIGLTPDPAAEDLSQVDFTAIERVALVVGAEGPGLTDPTLSAVQRRVRIPMHGSVDSLNVGVAASIAFWAVAQGSQPIP